MFSMATFAQLPNFTLTVTPTPQTCLGNGMLGFSVSGTNPSASIDYTVYLLPDTTTPVGVTTSSFLGSLSAGDYMVVATQSLGGNSNTQTASVTIIDQVIALNYLLQTVKVRCGADGKITVNVLTGTAVSYEIISGPVTRPLQPSNVFNNLPVGLYQVRVHDNCGNAVVVSVQLLQQTPTMSLNPFTAFLDPLPDCNTITIQNTIPDFLPPGTDIFLPITATYTVYPPNGGQPVTLLAPDNGLRVDIPFYNGEQYSYDVTVVDACGNVFEFQDFIITPTFSAIVTPEVYTCEDFSFSIDVFNYMPPFTVQFLDTPAGFNPASFNTMHPNFAETEQMVYGSETNSVPMGDYTVQVTDGCGNVAVSSFTIETLELTPQVVVQSLGCTSSSVKLSIPGRDIISIELVSAPAGYPEPLPQDLSAMINGDGEFMITGLAYGTYVFEFTDECGIEYTEEITVGSSTFNVDVSQRPGCEEGIGSMMAKGIGTNLTTATIISAPPAFEVPLPVSVSGNINFVGTFYMNSLPEGDYVFSFSNECGGIITMDITIVGYHKIVNSYAVTENCGSFVLNIQNASNGTELQQFWLQKYYPGINDWGHPGTGATAANISSVNAAALINNANNLSLPYDGQFRIVKTFNTYSNGSSANNKCIEVLHEFFISGGPQIIDYYNTPCLTGNVEVAIEAEGIGPLNYSVIEMNGEPFFIDNEESNVFTGLVPGTYIFRVEDSCGNYRNVQLDLTEVQPIEITASNLCQGVNGELSVPQFSFLSYEWYNGDDPDTILSTSNTLEFLPFNGNTDSGTYYVRVFTDNPVSCMNQILEYEVLPTNELNAGDDNTVLYCNDGSVINLENFLSNPHDEGGVWSDVAGTGMLSGSEFDIANMEEGTYEFRYIITGMCNMADEAVITINLRDIPDAPQADPVAAICEGGDIILGAGEVVNAVYEWTGPDNFTSSEQNPVITNAGIAAAGTYQVRVLVNGCASLTTPVDVMVKELPVFEIAGDASLCEGQTGQLEIISGNFDEDLVTYQWYLDNNLLEGVDALEIEVFETGVYSVTVSSDGCIAEESFEVIENTAAFDVVIENGCRDFDYMVWVENADDLDGVSYNWTGPEGFNAVGAEINISQLPAGTYTVEAKNAQGCSVTASVDIDNTFCLIPRGISPGDADYNNEFDLSNLNAQDLKIYNRYGLLVYEKQNYKNEWHGQSDKGDELPTGTYYYVVTLSAGKKVTGWVYLQRNLN